MPTLSRRHFLSSSAAAGAALGLSSLIPRSASAADDLSIGFGLVTYMWGADWDLPTLLANCKKTNVLGIELRTTHAHKVRAGRARGGSWWHLLTAPPAYRIPFQQTTAKYPLVSSCVWW
jgi:hypothetical protein